MQTAPEDQIYMCRVKFIEEHRDNFQECLSLRNDLIKDLKLELEDSPLKRYLKKWIGDISLYILKMKVTYYKQVYGIDIPEASDPKVQAASLNKSDYVEVKNRVELAPAEHGKERPLRSDNASKPIVTNEPSDPVVGASTQSTGITPPRSGPPPQSSGHECIPSFEVLESDPSKKTVMDARTSKHLNGSVALSAFWGSTSPEDKLQKLKLKIEKIDDQLAKWDKVEGPGKNPQIDRLRNQRVSLLEKYAKLGGDPLPYLGRMPSNPSSFLGTTQIPAPNISDARSSQTRNADTVLKEIEEYQTTVSAEGLDPDIIEQMMEKIGKLYEELNGLKKTSPAPH